MKAMKSMNVNRMFGSLKRRRKPDAAPSGINGATNAEGSANSNSNPDSDGGMVDSGLDTPEANATRNVVCLGGPVGRRG